MTRRFAPCLLVGLLAAPLCLPTVPLAAQAPRPTPPANQFAGLWDERTSQNYRLVVRLNADGTLLSGSADPGKWTVEANQLVLRYDQHPDWIDHLPLPVQDGLLFGQDANGGFESLTRRPTAAAAPCVGEWEFFNPKDGKRVKAGLAADGTFTENGQPAGFWQVSGDRLFLSYDSHHEWMDTYDLPARDGVLYGQNRQGDHLTLAKGGKTPGEAPARSSSADLTGGWNFFNRNDGKHATQTFATDGKCFENGKSLGDWNTVGDRLVLTYQQHDWKDTYYLSPERGVLLGSNPSGHRLVLSRPGATLPVASERPALASAGAAATTPGVRTGPASSGGGYFGARVPGAAGASTPAAATPPPAPSIPPPPAGSPVVAAAVTPAPVPPTPVGQWQWHQGAHYTFVSNGAIQSGANVVGQWKWTNQPEGQLQVRWSSIRFRPLETYQLSPQGNHLTWTNPPQGETKTENRVD